MVTEDVFVEVLSRPHAEHKASRQQRGRSRGCLSNNSRVHPDEWARHASAYPQPLSRLGNAADDAPHKGALALLGNPGMIVIREHGKREAGVLSLLGIAHQGARAVFFARELIADFNAWSPALWAVSALVGLHGGCQATFDVLPLHNAHELSSGRGHHHARCTMLPHILSDISRRTVGTDRRWT